MRCDEARDTLTEMVDGVAESPTDATRHVERCLRCQAQLAQHRRLRRAMVQLRAQTEDPGADLLVDLLSRIGAEGDHGQRQPSTSRHRAAYVAAAATAATAAGAAGALVLASRSRREAG